MPNDVTANGVSFNGPHARAERKAHDALTAAMIAFHRAEADYLERPTKQNRHRRDAAREVMRAQARQFRARVRERLAALGEAV